MRVRPLVLAAMSFLGLAGSVDAALIVNAAQPITERVRVQVITAANTDGTSAAPLFGTAPQQAAILSLIDTIWAQAGIDIDFTFRAATYNSTFANTGTAGSNNPRPSNDLNSIIAQATTAGGVISPDPTVINLFMVRIVPGSSQNDAFTSNGLAVLGGNGIAAYAGSSLPTFAEGQEAVATVIAHEIGHNLGLDHVAVAQNLMQAGGSANPGQRLDAAQIATAKASNLSVLVPEPTAAAAGLVGLALAAARRRRRAA